VLFLCALAALQRAAIVLAPRVDLYGRPERNNPVVVSIGEEIARGNLAADMLDGAVLPLIDYQYAHFFGGSLVEGLAAVPLFALFGRGLWTLKAVPILIHLAGIVLLVGILDRHVSRRAALFGGLAYALSPPGHALLTTIAWGSHVESNTLALALLAVRLSIGAGSRAPGRRFALGAVAGFALYFGYQSALAILAVGVLDLPRAARPGRRDLAFMALGFLVGFAPWLVYNLRHDFAGLSIYGVGLGEHVSEEGVARRLGHLATRGLPGALWLGSHALELLALGVGLLLVLSGARARGGVPAVARTYLVLFLAAFLASDFRIGYDPEYVGSYRYAYLLAPWVAMLAGVGLAELAARGPLLARVAGVVGWGLPAAFLVATFLVVCDPSRFLADRDLPGTNLESHARWLCVKHLDDQARIPSLVARIVDRRTPEEQRVLFEAMGRFLTSMARVGPRANPERRAEAELFREALPLFASAVPERYRAAFRAEKKQ